MKSFKNVFTKIYSGIILITVVSSIVSCSSRQAILPTDKIGNDIFTPPYIASTSKFIGVQFEIEQKSLRNLVPQNIHLDVNDEGLVAVSLEIYRTNQVFGIPQYAIAFITVGIENKKPANLTKGNLVIWGKVDNKRTLNAFQNNYQFPYKYEEEILIEDSSEGYMIRIGTAKDLVFQLKVKQQDKPVVAEGLAETYSLSSDKQFLYTQIPWMANGYMASLVSMEIFDKQDEILQVLNNATPVYAQVSSNVFSYSKPIRFD